MIMVLGYRRRARGGKIVGSGDKLRDCFTAVCSSQLFLFAERLRLCVVDSQPCDATLTKKFVGFGDHLVVSDCPSIYNNIEYCAKRPSNQAG